jgi:hypothetical protein
MAPSIDPSQWTYTDYTNFLRSHGFHNLSRLDQYLEWGLAARHTPKVRQPEFSRTALLEFTKNTTRVSDLSELNKLRLLLRQWTRPATPTSPGSVGPSGRIVLVENPAPALVDTLGGLLNIDPAFFAEHLEDAPGQSPDSSTIPSLHSAAGRIQKDFITLDYHSAFIPVNCPREVDGMSLHSVGNYPRGVDIVQKYSKSKVALASRKISCYFHRPKASEPWLCVILVDAPLGTFSLATPSFDSAVPAQQFNILPYQGGYLDFVEMRKPHSKQSHDFRMCEHGQSLPNPFDDLIRHFRIQARDGLFLDSTTASLTKYIRPCLQLAASENSVYLTYLAHILSSPHYSNPPSPAPTTLRRTLTTLSTIDTHLQRTKARLSRTKDALPSTSDLLPDYRGLLSTIHSLRSTIDTHTTHLTLSLHALETGALTSLTATSITRTQHTTYLLLLLLFYIPLSLTLTILSLPPTLAPSAHYLSRLLPPAIATTSILALLLFPPSRRMLRRFLAETLCGGGLTRRKLLRGERFRRDDGGAGRWEGLPTRTWVNSSWRDGRPDLEAGVGTAGLGSGG